VGERCWSRIQSLFERATKKRQWQEQKPILAIGVIWAAGIKTNIIVIVANVFVFTIVNDKKIGMQTWCEYLQRVRGEERYFHVTYWLPWQTGILWVISTTTSNEPRWEDIDATIRREFRLPWATEVRRLAVKEGNLDLVRQSQRRCCRI
jgi:hypothetical protein